MVFLSGLSAFEHTFEVFLVDKFDYNWCRFFSIWTLVNSILNSISNCYAKTFLIFSSSDPKA